MGKKKKIRYTWTTWRIFKSNLLNLLTAVWLIWGANELFTEVKTGSSSPLMRSMLLRPPECQHPVGIESFAICFSHLWFRVLILGVKEIEATIIWACDDICDHSPRIPRISSPTFSTQLLQHSLIFTTSFCACKLTQLVSSRRKLCRFGLVPK